MWNWKIESKKLIYSDTRDDGIIELDNLIELFEEIKCREKQYFVDLCTIQTWDRKRLTWKVFYEEHNLKEIVQKVMIYDSQDIYINEQNDLEIHDHHHDGTNIHRIRKFNSYELDSLRSVEDVRRAFDAGSFPDECTASLEEEIIHCLLLKALESHDK